MSMHHPTHNDRSFFSGCGGALLGGLLGGIVCFAVALAALKHMDFGAAGGFGAPIGVLYVAGIGAFVGAVIGYITSIFMPAASTTQRQGTVFGLIALGIVIGAGLCFRSMLVPVTQAPSQPMQQIQESAYRRPETRIPAAPTAPNRPQPPVEVHSVTEVLASYGALAYPRADIVPAGNPMPLPNVACGFIVEKSGDAFPQVVEYYRPQLTVIRDTPESFLGQTTRSSDGRRTFVEVKKVGDLVYISLSAG